MSTSIAKCIKSVKCFHENRETFTKGNYYEATRSLCGTTLHIHAINNENNSHGIGQFSFFGLIKDDFFKEHFVFVK